MKGSLENDKKKRNLYYLYYQKHFFFKIFFSEIRLRKEIRRKAFFKLTLLPLNSFFSRIRFRCFLSGRNRSVLFQKILGVSRLSFRSLINKRLIPFH